MKPTVRQHTYYKGLIKDDHGYSTQKNTFGKCTSALNYSYLLFINLGDSSVIFFVICDYFKSPSGIKQLFQDHNLWFYLLLFVLPHALLFLNSPTFV